MKTHAVRYCLQILRRTRVHHQGGFSLIELLIVVAIIGILSSIAVPNYLNFRNRVRQAEAKANLATLYAAEKAFQAEWGAFTGDFRDIGLEITGKLVFDLGFADAGYLPPPPFSPSGSAICDARTAYNTEVSACALTAGSFQARAMFRPAAASGPCGPGLSPTTTEFRATAVGILSGGRTGAEDIWTIDQNKFLCHNQDGSAGD